MVAEQVGANSDHLVEHFAPLEFMDHYDRAWDGSLVVVHTDAGGWDDDLR